MSAEARLLVRQHKGMAGRPWTQRLVLKGLGLSGPGTEVVVANDRAMRGMIRKVLHLVTVEEVGATSPTGATAKAGAPKAAAKSSAAKGSAPKASTAATKKVKS